MQREEREAGDRDDLSTRLREREAEVEALIKATQALFEMVFEQARRTTGATSGYVALLSPDGSENEVLFLEAGGQPCTVDAILPMPIREREQTLFFTPSSFARRSPGTS
jgi:hypothetical protein